MGLTGAGIAPFSYRKYLEEHWARMGRGSGVSRPGEQPKALPTLVPIQTLKKTPGSCLPGSWSLTGTPGTVLDVRAGKLSGGNDHSHGAHPAKEQHSTHRNPDILWYLSHLGSSRRHVLGGTSLRGRENKTKGYQLKLQVVQPNF